MATFLDIGIFQNFGFIFPVLLVFAIVYALLHKTNVLGKSPGINALVAAVAALTILLSQAAIDIVNYMMPWMSVAIIFFVLLLLVFQMMGVKEEKWGDIVKEKAVYWAILGILIIIVFAAFAHVLGQTMLEQGAQLSAEELETGVATGGFEQNVYATLFNTKVLGMIIIFTIVIFAVALLSGDATD